MSKTKVAVPSEPESGKVAGVVKSARRVLEIFELFAQVQQSMTLTEIARRLNYPAPSALALLKSLQALDFMAFDPAGKTYSPTMRVAMLGGWIQGRVFLEGRVVALMTELQERTGETVMLGMQNDIHAQYVHTVQSRRSLRYFLKPGTLRPIARSAMGIVLLAQLPIEVVTKLVPRINDRQGPGEPWVDADELLSKLAKVRRTGYAYSDQLTEGISAIAVPLRNDSVDRPMVLGLGGPTSRIKPKMQELAQLMRELIEHHMSPTWRETPSERN